MNLGIKIYINPEHGGSDPGASYGGIIEKNINLKAAKFCAEFLQSYDCTVFLSRDSGNKDLLISERLADLKAKRADCVITVAHNAGGGQGCEIFYRKGDDGAKMLAAALEKEYKAIGQQSRGIKESSDSAYNFGMVREPSRLGIPAVLSEFAFIDNERDRKMIDSDEKLRREGYALGKAAVKFLKIPRKESEEGEKLYRVQAGAFHIRSNAENYLRRLKELGFECFIWEDETPEGLLFKIQTGAFRNKEYAEKQLFDLREAGIEGYIYK